MSPLPILSTLAILITVGCANYKPKIVSHEVSESDMAPMPPVSERCPVSDISTKTWGEFVKGSNEVDGEARPEEAGIECVERDALKKDRECISRYNDESRAASVAQANVGTPVQVRSVTINRGDPGWADPATLKFGDILSVPESEYDVAKALYAPSIGRHSFFAQRGDDIRLVLPNPQIASTRTYQLCVCQCLGGAHPGDPVYGTYDVVLLPPGLNYRGAVEVPYTAAVLEKREFKNYPCQPCA